MNIKRFNVVVAKQKHKDFCKINSNSILSRREKLNQK